MQFCFMPGCGTSNATFLRQLQEIYSAKRRICTLYQYIWRNLLIKCLGMLYSGLSGKQAQKNGCLLRLYSQCIGILLSHVKSQLKFLDIFLLFTERVQAVIPSSASLAGIGCIRDVASGIRGIQKKDSMLKCQTYASQLKRRIVQAQN